MRQCQQQTTTATTRQQQQQHGKAMTTSKRDGTAITLNLCAAVWLFVTMCDRQSGATWCKPGIQLEPSVK